LLTDTIYRTMDDVYGPLLFEDDLSPEQRAALQERLEEDPELAEGWARWRRVRARLRNRLQERLPDRRLLVLYALDQDGRGDALTLGEKKALDAARDDIAEAIEAIPALQRVVERIQEERADFETVWAQHQEEAPSGTDASERRPRPDRDERSPRQSARSREGVAERRWAWRLTVAALLVGAAVLAIFYGPQEASRTTVTAGANEQRVVEFNDGSTVRLVGAATLTYDPEMTTTENWRVTLARGRAYFDVAPREDASFVVKTPAAQAEVLGTQFGVTTGSDTTEVVLVEGSVRVGPDDGAEAVVLNPGERSIVRRGTPPSPPEPADLTEALGWSGLFVFRSMTTEAIAQRLSEHYEVSIAVAPPLAEEPVTGTFEREQPVSQVLETIARTLGAEVRTKSGTYRLEPTP
jgi:ferric-dicitrate binding protein FerR (iron transport regulator)